MCFSFSIIFSFLAILNVLHFAILIFQVFEFFLPYCKSYSVCVCLIFHFIQGFSPYSSSYCVSFSFFSFSLFFTIFQVLQCAFLIFHPFSGYLPIFHVLRCVFLILHYFYFSHHTPGPTVYISHLTCF